MQRGIASALDEHAIGCRRDAAACVNAAGGD